MKLGKARFTHRPERDLEVLAGRSTRESGPDVATKVLRVSRIEANLVAECPLLGRARPDIRDEIGSWVMEPHVLFCRPTSDGIRVARVVDGRWDVPQLLEDQGSALTTRRADLDTA